MELFPENILAWNIFWDAHSPVANVLGDLDRVELGEVEASELAMKLRVLAEKTAEIEIRQAEQQTQELKNAGSTTRNRNR